MDDITQFDKMKISLCIMCICIVCLYNSLSHLASCTSYMQNQVPTNKFNLRGEMLKQARQNKIFRQYMKFKENNGHAKSSFVSTSNLSCYPTSSI